MPTTLPRPPEPMKCMRGWYRGLERAFAHGSHQDPHWCVEPFGHDTFVPHRCACGARERF